MKDYISCRLKLRLKNIGIEENFVLELREQNKSLCGYCVPSKSKIVIFLSGGEENYTFLDLQKTLIHEVIHLKQFRADKKIFFRIAHDVEFIQMENFYLEKLKKFIIREGVRKVAKKVKTKGRRKKNSRGGK